METPEADKFINRELSWIEFNARVLGEAFEVTNPLLERLKFLGIVSSNFDEFFMVRIPGLLPKDPLTQQIYGKAFDLMQRQEEFFVQNLVPELEKNGIVRLRLEALEEKQRHYLEALFHQEISSLLTPVALHEKTALPLLVNLSLYGFYELVNPKEPNQYHYAVIEIPKNYARMVSLPASQGYAFTLLEDIVTLFAQELFQGYQITDHGLFRLTRAAELTLDEEKDEDFAKVMAEALNTRRVNDVTRLEISASERMKAFLIHQLDLPPFSLYDNRAWFDLKSISQLAFQPMLNHLKRPPVTPNPVEEFEEANDVWTLLKERDVLVQHPYQSFDAFLYFLSQAADDPDVLVIKQTLYRAGDSSTVIKALERAAQNGKQVTVVVELKARFDEARNIEWARRLMNAGASVIYGVSGLKTHAKVCLVVRREIDGIKRYLHLSTGNYHERTACLYSDIALFTSKDNLATDLSTFFNIISGFSLPTGFNRIEISPYGLRKKLERLILRETIRSTKSQPGQIIAKMNSLVDPVIIEALYRASQAGVQIKLNVRGICCLRPGISGLSENIEVTSIVDMFLEHARIFYFRNGGDEEIYLSSADWMPRNLDRRLEILFPIDDEKNKKTLIETLKLYFRDNVKSWRLNADGSYSKSLPGDKPFRVQEYLTKLFSEDESSLQKSYPELKPQKPKKEARKSDEKKASAVSKPDGVQADNV